MLENPFTIGVSQDKTLHFYARLWESLMREQKKENYQYHIDLGPLIGPVYPQK
jgi:hypothetical protein